LLLGSCRSALDEDRLLASNIVVECTQPPGGLWFRVNVTPGKDYIVELAGEYQLGVPTLRIDLEDNDPANLQYLPVGGSGIKARVRSGGRLRLLIAQDTAFRYSVTALRVRPAVTAEDYAVPLVCREKMALPAWVYRIPAAFALPTASNEQTTAAKPADLSPGLAGAKIAGADKAVAGHAGPPPLLLTSWEFICLFLPILLLVHRLLGFGRWAVGFLVLASFFWYSVLDWRFGPLVLLSIAGNWWGGLVLEKRSRPWLLAALVLFNLLPLFYFKYIKFAFLAIGLRAGDWILPALIPQVLPLGISFYTFRNLMYVIDIYNGDKAERSWVHFAFFVLFFPHLLAGPITQPAQILPQLTVEPPDRRSMFLQGCIYFLIGSVKKLLVADILVRFVDPCFRTGHVQYADQAIVAALGYGLQLYFDFSGYSDMAVGLAAMFGFRLPWNFNSPYKARSFTEFWTRWHITLYAFLRDYIFVPLEVVTRGNPIPLLRTSINLLVTMLLCGLWHGAGWVFIIWGAGHGVLLCVQNAVGDRAWRRMPAWLRTAGVFTCVTLLWIPFRAESLSMSGDILRGFLYWRQVAWRPEFTYCGGGLLLVLFTPSSHVIAAYCVERLHSSVDAIWALGGRLGWYSMFSVLTAAAIIMIFYRGAPDPWLRSHLPLADVRDYVRNDLGDLRTNIDRCAALHGTNPKWVIAGPSYATALGLFTWMDGSEPVTVGSIGIGGQGIENWIRMPGAFLRDPYVRRIYIACEPVGMAPPQPVSQPFPGEGADVLAELGIKTSSRRLGSLGPASLGLPEAILDVVTLQLKSDKYFQFHAMLLAMGNGLRGNTPAMLPAPLKKEDLQLASQAVASLWSKAEASPKPPPDLANGAESKFSWNGRGIVEGLAEGGETDRVLGRLIDLARAKGIEIVLYGSPTLKHRPEIYPPVFFDRYQEAVTRFAKRHKVRYIDLSEMLPEDANAFYDFCHAREELRHLILKALIEKSDNASRP
jgi:alginate O-acetyltransferase complex protein AlgI